MTESRIFVHGLKAHADDMWASALLIASRPEIKFTEIIRDANRISEATENDFILDCGMKFDGIRLFDHHQLEHTEDVDCTLTLIAKTFAPWVLTDEKFGRMIERVRFQDNNGVPAAEKKFGKSAEWITSEFVLIGLFEEEPLKIANMLAEGFRKRLAEIEETEKAEEWIKKNSHTEFLSGKIKVFVCEESPFKAGFSVKACNEATNKYIFANKIDISYGWNGDGSDTRTLFRTKFSTNNFDFTKSDPYNAIFCHNGGFLLIFDPVDKYEYRKLIIQAACSFNTIK